MSNSSQDRFQEVLKWHQAHPRTLKQEKQAKGFAALILLQAQNRSEPEYEKLLKGHLRWEESSDGVFGYDGSQLKFRIHTGELFYQLEPHGRGGRLILGYESLALTKILAELIFLWGFELDA